MLLKTEGLSKTYPGSKNVKAVDAANIEIKRGETVALFGESGSGKSTLGMMIAGLLKPTAGRILWNGTEISMKYSRDVRRSIQIIFQHPETSFNPMLSLIRSLTEPYKIHNIPYSYEKLLEDIAEYGLYEEHIHRKPSQLSGGELQRAAIARVLTCQPDLIVLDEPTSMLDVIAQVQILNILEAYRKSHNASFLFISHNRILCEKLSTKMYSVEKGKFVLMD